MSTNQEQSKRHGSFSDFGAEILVVASPEDAEIYVNILNILTKEGLNVWPNSQHYEEGFDTNNLAKAINSCKCFIPVMSHASIQWKAMEDCLSLAYITSKRIFPIGYNRCGELKKNMSPGIKMIILTINWILINNPDTRESALKDFAKSVRDCLLEISSNGSEITTEEMISTKFENPIAYIHERLICGYADETSNDQVATLSPYQLGFWARHFGESERVSWDVFQQAFLEDYEERINDEFGDKIDWFINRILRNEILQVEDSDDDNDNMVIRKKFDSFLGNQDNSNNIYHYSQEYVTGKMAMKKVFGMKSDVRLEVIKNIGKFSTPYVISRLLSMLTDDDPDIRAVAALALGNGTHSPDVYRLVVTALANLLNDRELCQDRLVKESVILALGKLKAKRLIPYLAHLWRNDAIKDVREAAEVALKKIGGKEVDDIFRVTETLNKEVEYLRKNKIGLI